MYLFLILLLFTSSVMSDSLWPLDCSTPGFPILHYFPEFVQTHVHWVSDAVQLSHPLSPSSLALNLSLHQGRFQWVGSSYQVAKVLELQHQSFQWIQGWFPLGLTGLTSLLSKGFSRVFFSTIVWKHQFFGAQPSLWPDSHMLYIIHKSHKQKSKNWDQLVPQTRNCPFVVVGGGVWLVCFFCFTYSSSEWSCLPFRIKKDKRT